jgi:hypothetical protein
LSRRFVERVFRRVTLVASGKPASVPTEMRRQDGDVPWAVKPLAAAGVAARRDRGQAATIPPAFEQNP